MFYFNQFDAFDPLLGEAPSYPFSCLPEIAGRARMLLTGKTKAQIVKIAESINSRIDAYFRDQKDMESIRLQSELDVGCQAFNEHFEWSEEPFASGRWQLRESILEELDIQTAENTSEVDALKSIIEKRDDFGFFGIEEQKPQEYPDGRDHEFFAVLALWLLADSIRFSNKTEPGLSIAGGYAIKAMDAICYAEYLHEIRLLLSNADQSNQKDLRIALRKQRAELAEEMRHRQKVDEERLSHKKSALGKKLNLARHKTTHEAKALVIAEWEKDVSAFPSADKAGLHFADWLMTKGIVKTIEPRTVTSWIRAYAKEKGVRFR